MNFLAIARRVARECRMTASATVPSTTVNQSGNLLDAVTWAQDAWRELQLSNEAWRWMLSRFSLETVANTDTYAYGDCEDEYTAVTIARFRGWRFGDTMDQPLCYLQANGVGSQGYLAYVPWELFRQMYKIGTVNPGMPAHITVDPANNLVIGPTPNDVYVITGPYSKSAQELTNDTDIPEMPTDYHMVIVYDAMRKYAGSESANEILFRASNEGNPIKSALRQNQSVPLRYARAMT